MTTHPSSTRLTSRCEPPKHLALPAEVHLWMDDGQVPIDCGNDDTSRLLSVEERGRQLRYVSPELQARFERRRVMLRQVLSHYRTDVLPEEWRFVHNDQGRPAVDPQVFGDKLHFNLSHSKNRTLIAIAAHCEIGVDIEHTIVAPDANHLDVAEQYFTLSECHWINSTTPENRMHRFFDLWTLKESYIKARGQGLSLPLDYFQFTVSDAGAVALQELNKKMATEKLWQFTLDTLETHYRYAIALQHSGPESLDVQRFDFPRCLHAL